MYTFECKFPLTHFKFTTTHVFCFMLKQILLHGYVLLCLLLQILVLNTNTQELVASFRVTTGTSNTTAIKSIEFARKGRWEPTRGIVVSPTWTHEFNLDCNYSLIGFLIRLVTLFSPLSLILPCFPFLPCFMRSCFLINTADRIIRVYDGREILTCGRDGEPEPMQKLQDLVNRYSRQDYSVQSYVWVIPIFRSFIFHLRLQWISLAQSII